MNILVSYIDSAKHISITVATPCQHIRRIIPIDRAVKIRQAFDEAISEADKFKRINKQPIKKIQNVKRTRNLQIRV